MRKKSGPAAQSVEKFGEHGVFIMSESGPHQAFWLCVGESSNPNDTRTQLFKASLA